MGKLDWSKIVQTEIVLLNDDSKKSDKVLLLDKT